MQDVVSFDVTYTTKYDETVVLCPSILVRDCSIGYDSQLTASLALEVKTYNYFNSVVAPVVITVKSADILFPTIFSNLKGSDKVKTVIDSTSVDSTVKLLVNSDPVYMGASDYTFETPKTLKLFVNDRKQTITRKYARPAYQLIRRYNGVSVTEGLILDPYSNYQSSVANFIVRDKYGSSSGSTSGTGSTTFDNPIIGIKIKVNPDAYVGLGSDSPDLIDTVTDDQFQVLRTNGEYTKVNHDSLITQNFTGVNDVQVSVSVQPTFVIEKITKS